MATLALGVAGAAIGGAALPGGISFLGTAISGASLGFAIGSAAGSLIDQSLFAPSGKSRAIEGPRLGEVRLSGSTEGAPIARLYGRARLPGQLIWATRFEEEVVTSSQTTPSSGGGGKGGGGGSSSGGTTETRTEYRYYANVAYALCDGEITRVGRIWADGKELDQSQFLIRAHKGGDAQERDSLIQTKEGIADTPAYRGTAYVVFERMALARFGNRLPQLSFEVFRAVDGFEKSVRSVTLIPSAGEFVYAPGQIVRSDGIVTTPENVHTFEGNTDFTVALDQLEAQLPNVTHVSLVVAWFGNDLRAGHCMLRPGVEVADKTTSPQVWRVDGLDRDEAHVVSQIDGRPAYGGTPSDRCVVDAIRNLKARGFAVTFYPFIVMDVASGNGLPDPYGGAEQGAYPWRGRITCHPAAGAAGTPDKSPDAGLQVGTFIGAATAGDFAIAGDAVSYAGPPDWGFRRFILHYAHLCEAAGGVDSFLIGSEMRGLTWVRDGQNSYPFVDALVVLAANVNAVLRTSTKISYAADWSEYFGHQPADGSGDVHFHLDPLWASAAIDAVAIDCYWPLSDWRDGRSHLDRLAGHGSIYELDYLKGNIFGGEGYDWYYQSAEHRDAQVRTPITDSAGKPWVFRFKDLRAWWLNAHRNRPGGVEQASPTAWTPRSKPVWFTELGCPAVDKGANQPNVFIDPKSSESFAPYYSSRVRDDLIQRRYAQAFIEFFDPAHEDYIAGSNPLSPVYGGLMIPADRIALYTWDARPYPAFPNALDVWSDGGNWEFGHWLTGRVGGGPLAAVVAAILEEYGFVRYSVAGLTGSLDGFVIDRIMSARAALQPLELAFFFDAIESAGLIQFRHRGRADAVATLAADDLVERSPEAELYELTRGQETELPAAAKLTYVEAGGDYRQAAVEARRIEIGSSHVAAADLPIVLGQAQAQGVADQMVQDAWAAREIAKFVLPPSRLALEPSDVVALELDTRVATLRLIETRDGVAKEVEARSIEPDLFGPGRAPARQTPQSSPVVFGKPTAIFLDLPLLRGDEIPHAGWFAANQSPWPGAVGFYRSSDSAGFVLDRAVTARATTGVTLTDFHPGPAGRFDRANALRVKLEYGAMQSITELALLGGGNVAGLENADGEWEVIQFQNAELVAPDIWQLSVFLRGQGGTETFMREPVAAGARFVLLDGALVQSGMAADQIVLPFNWRIGPLSRDIGDASYTATARTFRGLGLKPLAPVHLRGRREGGDIRISWIRRTRIGGDSWETVDPPLGEDREAYEIAILDGGAVKRTLSTATASAVYSAADEIADFGASQPSIAVRAYQLSAAYGRGHPGTATLHV